jgi:pimeloyl-ACP methyl ester carboxylesterase
MRKGLTIALIVFVLLLLAAVAGFVIWGSTPAEAMPEALAALESNSKVTVTMNGDWLIFSPADSEPTTGLILYPGGRVDYRAYAPAAHQIAAQGYLVVIDKMPLNLAVLDAAAAQDVIAAYPEIERWVVGGHSLGGAMAANFASSSPDAVDGLLLWAAYPSSSDDLSDSGLPVASIYGTRDGLSDDEAIDASRALLPADTQWTAIEGGNHAQFGWYGEQSGDNPATISREQQQEQIVAASLALLESLR